MMMSFVVIYRQNNVEGKTEEAFQVSRELFKYFNNRRFQNYCRNFNVRSNYPAILAYQYQKPKHCSTTAFGKACFYVFCEHYFDGASNFRIHLSGSKHKKKFNSIAKKVNNIQNLTP